VFAIFGKDNFRAVLALQVLIDVGTCLILADAARRCIRSERAAKGAFAFTALCPFLANYAGAVLTETLEIFFTALALDLACAGLETLRSENIVAHKIWLNAGRPLALQSCCVPMAESSPQPLADILGFSSFSVAAVPNSSLCYAHAFGLRLPATVDRAQPAHLHRFQPLAHAIPTPMKISFLTAQSLDQNLDRRLCFNRGTIMGRAG